MPNNSGPWDTYPAEQFTLVHKDHLAAIEAQRDQALAERDEALARLAEARTELLSTASYLEAGMDLDVSPQVFVVFDQLADSLRRAADPIAPAPYPKEVSDGE